MQEQESGPSSLREMEFADLYLGHPELGDRFSTVPKAPTNPVIASPSLQQDLSIVRTACNARYAHGETDFRFEHDELTYRVSVMETIGGPVFVLRKMDPTIRTLQDLRIPASYRDRILEPDQVGLMLVVGTMNSGKTTTAGSIVAARLAKFGGVAVTAEDPIEAPLEGQHGPGICFQTSASPARGGFAAACRTLMRSGANIIYLGEIRDGDTAVEALRAGINGHLVVSTLHAEDIITGLMRLHAMAVERMDQTNSRQLLADGINCVVHQRLTGDPRRPTIQMLSVRRSMEASAMLRDGHFERLLSVIDAQTATMLNQVRAVG